MRKLYKSRNDKKICGVCGGIAQFFGIDSTLVRVITVLLVALGGMSIWIYVIAALVMSVEPVYSNAGDYQD
ncbi:MAG: PspC domain-containing protein [Lachnospiraceae bacterium]|nr:PspC domain-containing protein [Lachnospiraceae bacterium]